MPARHPDPLPDRPAEPAGRCVDPSGLRRTLTDPSRLRWVEAETLLLGWLVDDLRQGGDAVPTLLAFAGDEPIAIVAVRRFGPGEVGQALLEVLALLLPLGTDRLAFGATGRIWSLDDPVVPACDEGDLRQRVIVVTSVDAHDGQVTMHGSIHPFDDDRDGVTLLPPVAPDDQVPEGPVAGILAAALDQRHELAALTGRHELVTQLGRVLLLGHDLALAPDPAATLAAATGS